MHTNIRQAHAAPRCSYIRFNDQRCTQPALHDQQFCRFHDLLDKPLPLQLIPFVEDATSLQVALMQVIRSIQFGLQIAASNLKYFCAENGHPLADAMRKTKKEEEEPEGPSLAEYLLEQLGIAPPDQAQAKDKGEDEDVPPRTSASPAVKAVPDPAPRIPDSGVIDKLEACDSPAARSPRPAGRLGISPTLAGFPLDAVDNRGRVDTPAREV